MWREVKMEQIFQVDLRKIEGEGEFPCPTCGEVISPDNYSGITYSISNIKTKGDGAVQEITVQCGRCGSAIRLYGFDLLEDLRCTYECFNTEGYLSFRVDLRQRNSCRRN